MNKKSDSTLIACAKQDSEAFGLLYDRYVNRIYNYIYYRTGNHHDAEDLTARTFYKALEHLARYVDRGAPFSAYLYRIAHNMVANWHRDTNRRQIISLDDLIITVPSQLEPNAIAERRDEQEELLRAVRQLPPERQQLLILKLVEQMSNAEIAQVMKRTEGAIKSLYHRTLVALREEYGNGNTTGLDCDNKETGGGDHRENDQ